MNAIRPCPVCRSIGSTLLYRQSFEQLSRARLLDGYDVLLCRECGAGFAGGIPPQEVFDGYYRDLSKYDELSCPAGSHAIDPRFHSVADLLTRFLPTFETRIFEIGSASGSLLKALQQRGFRNLYGSDPSPACVRASQELHGIPAVAGTVFTVPDPPVPYDFVVAVGVMEHIRDLDLTAERFHSLLREGGRVYLEVPDASRYTPQQDAPFQEFSIEHINFFSPQSLANLMQARGFRVLEIGRVLRQQHEIICPAAYGVFERSDRLSPIERDLETEPALRAYVEGCLVEDSRIRALIRDATAPGEQLIVWGVGAHTLRLLATGGLDPAHVSLFVDSNPNYQRQELCGVPVASPAALKNRREPILISSCSSQNSIHRQVREGLGLLNPVILLYSQPGRCAHASQDH
jgi:SAM-dependent methyltransferase